MGYLSVLPLGAVLLVVVTAQRSSIASGRGGFSPPAIELGGFSPMTSSRGRVSSRGRQVNFDNPRGTTVNIGGRNSLNNAATDRADPLSAVPSISTELRNLKRRNEPISLVSLWNYVLTNDGQGPGPAQRINFEPKTILVPENYVTGRHLPADVSNPLYNDEQQKFRRDFVMDHLVLDLVELSDPQLSKGNGVKALTFSKKEVFIRTDNKGKTFVDFVNTDKSKNSVEVTATASLNDGTQVYWIENFLFDNGIKLASAFRERGQGFSEDSLFGPIGPPLDLSALLGPVGPPLDFGVAPPAPPAGFSPQRASPPALPSPTSVGIVGPPSFRIDDAVNTIDSQPRRPFNLGRAQPAAPFGAGGGIGRRPVPFGNPLQFEDQQVDIGDNAGRLLFDPVALDEVGRRPSPLFLANRPGRTLSDEVGSRPSPQFLANRPGRTFSDEVGSRPSPQFLANRPGRTLSDEVGSRPSPQFLANRPGRTLSDEVGSRPSPQFLANRPGRILSSAPVGPPSPPTTSEVDIGDNSGRSLFDSVALGEVGRRPSPLFLAPTIEVEDSSRTGRAQPLAPFGAGGGIGRRPVPFGLPVDFGDTPSAVVETSARRARGAFKSSPREGAPGQMTPSFFLNKEQVRN